MRDTRADAVAKALQSAGAAMGGDQQLLERFVADGDEAAFAGLVQRHGRCVWGVCRRTLGRDQDAEDAFQSVFLLLARKAASIRKREAVASWLYGVAYRLSMRAKQSAARRQEREKKMAQTRPEQSPPSEAAYRELQRILDQEVQRLQDKYRTPFVLCCLEGMSKAEAAKELGWKEGTVSGRLARARELLQSRMARRGFTLSAALTATALTQHTAWAVVPTLLMQTTASAVLASKACTPLSASALAVAKDYLQQMNTVRLGAALAVLLALILLIGGTGLAVMMLNSAADEAVVLVEPETFAPPGVPLGTPVGEQVLTVAFSPDGRRLATAGAWGNIAGQLKIWDVATAEEVAAIRLIPGVRGAAFSPDGATLATGDFSGALTLRDPFTGEELAKVNAHVGGVHGVAFSRDGDFLASAGLDQSVKLWSGRGLREQKEFLGHTDHVLAVAFFGHGKTIVTGSRDRTAKIWDLTTGRERFTLASHASAVECVAVSPDDKFVATVSSEQRVKLWDAETGTVAAVLEGDPGQAFIAAAFSPDGKFIAAAGRDGTIRLWNAMTRQSAGTLRKHAATIWALAFSRDGVLASGSSDKTAKLWRLGGTKEATTLTTSWSANRRILAAVYAPSGNVLAIGTSDATVHIRDAKSGDVIKVLRGHTAPVTCLTFTQDGNTLASGSHDHTVRLWHLASGDAIHTFAGHVGAVYALLFTADGKKLASAGDDKVIRMWDVVRGKELAALKGHEGTILALAISPEGAMLASGGADRTIKIWDLTTESERHSLEGHDGAVCALKFSSDGVLVSASEDTTVRLWEPFKGTQRLTLAGHTGPVLALAFSPKGRILVSAGQDQTVRAWDSGTGQPRGILHGHKDSVTALAIHPYGHNLVSGSLDTLLLRWQAGKLPKAVGGAATERKD